MEFYDHILSTLIKEQAIGPDDSILIVCGGTLDIEVMQRMGFKNITVSNLDERYDEESKPFSWTRQDAEQLDIQDQGFDWAFVHAGLHHCASPHKALLEMLRVSRKGALIIEARDSAVMRIAVRLGLTETHEVLTVKHNEYLRGGVRNSHIPNFVYRWTEREVTKLVESAYPERVNSIRFFYGMRLPIFFIRERVPRVLASVLWGASKVIQKIAPRQCNCFGFLIRHTRTLKPWLTTDGVRRDWF